MNRLAVFSMLVFGLVFCSCQSDKVQGQSETIQVDLNNALTGLKLSSFLEEPDFILLKDPPETLLVTPYQFQFKNNKIFVRDLDYNNIHVYSKNGEFLNAILSSGEGPQEFIQINDFFVTEDQVIIQDTFLRKIIVFDHEGNFTSERKHLINNSRFAFSADKFVYYMANDPEFDGRNFLIEEDGEISARLQPIETELEGSGKFLLANSFVPLGGERFLFYRPYTYQMNYLDLKMGRIEKSISFDFGEAQLTPAQHVMSIVQRNKLLTERNLVPNFTSVLPTSNGTLISFFRGFQKRYYLHLSQDQKSTVLISEPENDLFPITLNFPWTTDGSRIYYFLKSIDFYNQYAAGFSGKKVSIEAGNIHDFFQKNKELLIEDRTLLISFKVKDTIQELRKNP